MEKVSINGYVLDATTEEDHKRAMLHAVLDALDMDIEKEIHIYRISKGKIVTGAGVELVATQMHAAVDGEWN